MKNIKVTYNSLSILNYGITKLFLLIFLTVGILTRQFGLLIFSFLLLAIVILSYFWCKAGIKKVLINLIADQYRLFPGQEFELTLDIHNNKVLPVSFYWDYFFNKKAFEIINEDQKVDNNSYLLWFQRARIHNKIKTLKRGFFEIKINFLKIGDFFGFYHTEIKTDKKIEIIVYPHILPMKDHTVIKRDIFDIWEGKNFIEDPVNIVGLREYHYNKPAKYINWKASAKNQILLEKVTEPTINARILLIIDIGYYFSEKGVIELEFEAMLSGAASLAFQFNKFKYPMGLMTNGKIGNDRSFDNNSEAIKPAFRVNQLPNILGTLAKLNPVLNKNIDLLNIIEKNRILSNSVSVVYYSYNNDLLIQNNFFISRKTPCLFIVNKITDHEVKIKNLYRLDELFLDKHRIFSW